MLLAVAAGPRAERGPAALATASLVRAGRLAAAAREELDPGDRLGVALACFSALDGRLAWLSAGAWGPCCCAAAGWRRAPPGGHALSANGGVPRGAVVDSCRDDVLVLAAAALDDAGLAALASPDPRRTRPPRSSRTSPAA